MSELFKTYVEGTNESIAARNIVKAIATNKISYAQALDFINELDEKGLLNDAKRDLAPQHEWTEEYLSDYVEHISSGAFSREYLTDLANIANHVKQNKTKKSSRFLIVAIIASVAIIIAIIAILVSFQSEAAEVVQEISQQQNDVR